MLNVRYKSRRLFFAPENFLGNGNGIDAGDANQRDRAFASGSRNGGNRLTGDEFLVPGFQIGRSLAKTSFNAPMHL
jgi:hypothetical protein